MFPISICDPGGCAFNSPTYKGHPHTKQRSQIAQGLCYVLLTLDRKHHILLEVLHRASNLDGTTCPQNCSLVTAVVLFTQLLLGRSSTSDSILKISLKYFISILHI
jgi:hypothetical protein